MITNMEVLKNKIDSNNISDFISIDEIDSIDGEICEYVYTDVNGINHYVESWSELEDAVNVEIGKAYRRRLTK